MDKGIGVGTSLVWLLGDEAQCLLLTIPFPFEFAPPPHLPHLLQAVLLDARHLPFILGSGGPFCTLRFSLCSVHWADFTESDMFSQLLSLLVLLTPSMMVTLGVPKSRGCLCLQMQIGGVVPEERSCVFPLRLEASKGRYFSNLV